MIQVNYDQGSLAGQYFRTYPWTDVLQEPRNSTFVPEAEPMRVRQSYEVAEALTEIDDEEVEPMQICNLNESVLRLEELAQKREMTFKLNNDGMDGLQALYHELVELNSRATMSPPEQNTPWFTDRSFYGLRSEDVDLLDERKLTQLVYEFGLENIQELPVLKMDDKELRVKEL